MTDEQKNSTESNKPKDRNLGDEWSDWVGDLSAYEKDIKEGRSLFLVFYFTALLLLTIIVMFLYYLISPRLYQLHPYADTFVLWLIIITFGGIFIWSLLLLLTMATGINLLPLRRKSGLHLEWVYPIVYTIAGMFKISKDRATHSLLKINNVLIYTTKKKFKSSNLLVLLPRCLDRETREKVLAITQGYGCTVFTATGGQSARQMVKKARPDAIIGVACERDLVAGMSDSSHYVPVIAITNQRPNGPCKDTFIDVGEFEKAVKFLLKK
jgi:uncharacterized protein